MEFYGYHSLGLILVCAYTIRSYGRVSVSCTILYSIPFPPNHATFLPIIIIIIIIIYILVLFSVTYNASPDLYFRFWVKEVSDYMDSMN